MINLEGYTFQRPRPFVPAANGAYSRFAILPEAGAKLANLRDVFSKHILPKGK